VGEGFLLQSRAMAAERSLTVLSCCSLSERLPHRSSLPHVLSSITLALCLYAVAPASGDSPQLAWTEDFATDPVVNNRFSIEPAGAAGRFTYDAGQALLTAHYNTLESTAWYVRPLDPSGIRRLNRYDDFEFSVTFLVRSEHFDADPEGFAQIAWGLINSQTTGTDRAGGAGGPYAFDCLTSDYFPNISPTWGGPTICPSILYSDDGDGGYPAMSFAQYQEGLIDFGDETIALDTVNTARVVYDGLSQVVTLTIRQGDRLLSINVVGAGGITGGLDGDPTTIQTQVSADQQRVFALDSLALTAWQDSYCVSASVIADVEISHIDFSAPAVLLGDLNHDGLVNGRDIEPFQQALLSSEPCAGAVARGDFSGNGSLDLADVQPFVTRLAQP
jgi:hypothetical protein